MSSSILLEKSLKFASRIIKLNQYLIKQKHETIISKQIIRSGTSIGANANEAAYGNIKADFIAKMQIALEETAETEYWLRLLMTPEYITEAEGDSLINDCFLDVAIIVFIFEGASRNAHADGDNGNRSNPASNIQMNVLTDQQRNAHRNQHNGKDLAGILLKELDHTGNNDKYRPPAVKKEGREVKLISHCLGCIANAHQNDNQTYHNGTDFLTRWFQTYRLLLKNDFSWRISSPPYNCIIPQRHEQNQAVSGELQKTAAEMRYRIFWGTVGGDC